MSQKISEDRIYEAISKAEGGFWKIISNEFPEVKSGDLAFDQYLNLNNSMKESVMSWLKNNHDNCQNCKNKFQPAKFCLKCDYQLHI